MYELAVSAVVTLFVIIDPIGLVPIFMSVTANLEQAQRRSVAIRSAVITAIVLALFALGGHRFLALIGISLPAFRIAGGFFLFYIAFEMVMAKREVRKTEHADRTIRNDHPADLAAFPMAVPLMAGPGAITATMLLAEHASGDWRKLTLIIGVIVLISAVNALVLIAATPLDRFMGDTVRNIMTRLLGVVLAALAVQFVIDGVLAVMKGAGQAG